MSRKELRLYGDLIYQHKPTIRTVLWKILLDYFAKKNRHRKSVYRTEEPLEQIVRQDIPVPEMSHFAIIKDGIVEEIIVVNPIIADLLKYKRLKFIKFSPSEELVQRGMQYKDNQFIEEESNNDKEN